jgi:hypothetical protein
MLEKFQTYQQVLFDLTANYLEPMDSAYQRLAYLFGLREPVTGKYVHESLGKLYGPEVVSQVISQCHEEVFERLLEMPLNAQGDDLRALLGSSTGTLEANAKQCRENCRKWVPASAPSYLRELYCSNLDALLDLLTSDISMVRPSN